MRLRFGLPVARPLGRVMALTVIGGLAAGCSSDSARFGENPFGNPFASRVGQPADTLQTGSVTRGAAAASGGLSSPGLTPRAAVPSRTVAANSSVLGAASGWSSTGGTPVTLSQGESIMTLSERYGVPPQALLSANGLTSASQVQPGQQLMIPVYKGAGAPSANFSPVPRAVPAVRPVAAAATAAAEKPAPVPVARPVPAKAVAAAPVAAPAKAAAPVKAAATAKAADDDEDEVPAKAKPTQPAPAAKPKPAKVAAAAENADDDDDKAVVKPVAKSAPAAAKPEAPSAKVAQAPAPAVKAEQPAKANVRKISLTPQEPEKAAPEKAAPAKAEPAKTAPAKEQQPEHTGSIAPAAAPAAADRQDFRWPARGRVIGGYQKGANDGINISLPEGTPVKAAEGGTVAYAGEELKGYGKLVLVRHPNGWVSAYAHNGELMVKRGETIKRGQVVAKSGQSGNVSSPQLHFELRQGSSPVDPTPHLN
jgi:murein DD-endopeptidase MepM/ murein hydrolase activator NlpD